MPRKEYKTITVKKKVFENFVKLTKDIKAINKTEDNSTIIQRMIDNW